MYTKAIELFYMYLASRLLLHNHLGIGRRFSPFPHPRRAPPNTEEHLHLPASHLRHAEICSPLNRSPAIRAATHPHRHACMHAPMWLYLPPSHVQYGMVLVFNVWSATISKHLYVFFNGNLCAMLTLNSPPGIPSGRPSCMPARSTGMTRPSSFLYT